MNNDKKLYILLGLIYSFMLGFLYLAAYLKGGLWTLLSAVAFSVIITFFIIVCYFLVRRPDTFSQKSDGISKQIFGGFVEYYSFNSLIYILAIACFMLYLFINNFIVHKFPKAEPKDRAIISVIIPQKLQSP